MIGHFQQDRNKDSLLLSRTDTPYFPENPQPGKACPCRQRSATLQIQEVQADWWKTEEHDTGCVTDPGGVEQRANSGDV